MSRGGDLAAKVAAGAAALAGACAAGALPSLLPVAWTIAVAAAGLATLLTLALRRMLSVTGRPATYAPAVRDTDASVDTADLRLPRVLFYCGCLLLAEPKFRVGGVTLAELLFIAAFVLCLFAVLRGRAVPPVPPTLVIAVASFVLGGTLSSLGAQSAPGSALELVHALYVLLLWPVVAAMVLQTRRQLLLALTLWTVSAAVEGAAALVQALGVEALGLVHEGSRMTGFTPHPNDLGGATAIPLVIALMLATHGPTERRGYGTMARWLVVVLIAVGISLSGSITAMASAGAALLLWLSWPPTRTASSLGFVVAVFCVLAAIAITSPSTSSPVTRLAQVANPTAESGGSLQDRFSLAKQAWPRITRDPVVGAGLDTADSVLPIISQTYDTSYQLHSLPLAAWYQTGIFGLIGILGLLTVLAVMGWRAVRAAVDREEVILGLSLLGAFSAFVIEAMSVPMVFQQYSWVAAALLFAFSLQSVGQPRAADLDGNAVPEDRPLGIRAGFSLGAAASGATAWKSW